MGQKTNPVGFRLGVIRGWDSNWYAEKDFAEKLVEDHEIRNYMTARLKRAGLSRVVIERTPKRVILTLHTSRPGVVIGRGGTEVEKLREELKKLTNKDIQININEIKRPELDASLVAQNIAQQLEGRVSFRRAMKQSLTAAMRMGAQGIRVKLSGRLGGAEMGRVEQYLEGQVPLHTIRADIDYAEATAYTIYGTTGVKVWIYRGEILGRPDLSPNVQAQRQQMQQMQPEARSRGRRNRDARSNDKPGGRGRGRRGSNS
ncbi:MAG: 30S ribosomal protein S3 [Bacteroidetes bacterium]|nr:30S ribosomal protein S3 [Bacteroidota bacterium]